MEDRAATFRKQSIHRTVPVVSQERAFRVKVLVALVAFCHFFTDMYRAACYGEVGQLQTLHHLPSTISDSVSYLGILVTRSARRHLLINRASCLPPRKLFFLPSRSTAIFLTITRFCENLRCFQFDCVTRN